MANRTDADAATVHGTNPQTLVEKIVRSKIYQSTFWKESCFALNAESLVDKGAELKSVGGTYGGARQPCEFLCLILKMLQIQPDREVILEYILQEDYKYLRLLGAFYLRLVGKPDEVYRYIEPLFNDYRKARIKGHDGNYALTHMDVLAEDMIYKDYLFDISLPRLPQRYILEREQVLGARISGLDDHDIATLEAEAEKEAVAAEEMIAEQNKAANKQTTEPESEPIARDAKKVFRKAYDDDMDARRAGRSRDDTADASRSYRDRPRESERDRDYDRDRARRSDREYDRDRDRDHRDYRSREQDRDRRESDYRKDRTRDRDRDYRERESARDKGREKDYARDKDHRERDREHDRDRERGRDRDGESRKNSDKGHDKDRRREDERESERDGRERKRSKKDGDLSVDETNKLRESLGMKPLT